MAQRALMGEVNPPVLMTWFLPENNRNQRKDERYIQVFT